MIRQITAGFVLSTALVSSSVGAKTSTTASNSAEIQQEEKCKKPIRRRVILAGLEAADWERLKDLPIIGWLIVPPLQIIVKESIEVNQERLARLQCVLPGSAESPDSAPTQVTPPTTGPANIAAPPEEVPKKAGGIASDAQAQRPADGSPKAEASAQEKVEQTPSTPPPE